MEKPQLVSGEPRGKIDYEPIFGAAKGANIKHYFVEQEAFPDAPPFEVMRVRAAPSQNSHRLQITSDFK